MLKSVAYLPCMNRSAGRGMHISGLLSFLTEFRCAGAAAGVIEEEAWARLSDATKQVLQKWDVRAGKGPGGLAGKGGFFAAF